jgi:type VI protein secretion system component Hcp
MAIYVKIPHVGGDVTVPGYEECFVADSFSFGVEREMKESGEKGGTEDINIGVGELQECTISKSMDATSTMLAQFAINGNSLGKADIFFVEVGGGGGVEGQPHCYLQYSLDRCFVKSWSTSGDADDRPTEEVAFYYNRIAFNYANTKDGKSFKPGKPMTWDNVKNKPWDGHGISLKS